MTSKAFKERLAKRIFIPEKAWAQSGWAKIPRLTGTKAPIGRLSSVIS